jgi:hypothetical protein
MVLDIHNCRVSTPCLGEVSEKIFASWKFNKCNMERKRPLPLPFSGKRLKNILPETRDILKGNIL